MDMKRILVSLGILIVVAALLTACGAAATPPGLRESLNTTTSGGKPASPPAPAAAPTMAPAAAPSKGAPGVLQDSFAGTASTAAADQARLIIRNGTISIVVKDVNASVGDVTNLATAAGGLVLSTSSRLQGSDLYATVVIKVPVERFDDVMSQLRKLTIRPDGENSSTQDVTEDFVDLDARLKVYQATEQQLLKFLDRTQSVDESLKVYNQLMSVQSQIESLKGRMNYLTKSAAMSTITASIRPDDTAKPIVEEGVWSPMAVVRAALRSLVSAAQSLGNALIYFVIVVLPVLIVLAVLYVIARAIWRRIRRTRPAGQ
jgi:hypothetical protein